MLGWLCVSTWDMEWHGMTWIRSAAAHWQEWISWSETVPAGLHLQTIQAFSWEWLRKLECFGMKWMSFPPFDGALKKKAAVNQHSPPFVKPYTFQIDSNWTNPPAGSTPKHPEPCFCWWILCLRFFPYIVAILFTQCVYKQPDGMLWQFAHLLERWCYPLLDLLVFCQGVDWRPLESGPAKCKRTLRPTWACSLSY